MKNATEWPSRTEAPFGSISGIAVPSSSRLTSREWCMPIQ